MKFLIFRVLSSYEAQRSGVSKLRPECILSLTKGLSKGAHSRIVEPQVIKASSITSMQTDYTSNVKRILPQAAHRSSISVRKDIMVGLLLLAAPFLLFPRGYGLLALLALPAIWLFRWATTGQPLPRTALDWPILLLTLSTLLSMWATFDLSFSVGKIAGLLLGISVFYMVVDLVQSRPALGRMIMIFVAGGAGLALMSTDLWKYVAAAAKSPCIMYVDARFERYC